MKRVAIIGGGISGLASAHRILERCQETGEQIQLTLLESSDRLGGIVQTQQRDGFLIENGPDSFISDKPAALELARRLGLESHLIKTNQQFRRSFVVRNGRLRPVPRGFHLLAPGELWPFLKSDIFSWRGKARMALDLALPRARTTGEKDESLASFVRRRLGREALTRMAQPMIGGIYTADAEKLSLRATMPRFLEMERDHRSVIRALRKQDKTANSRQGPSGTSGARYSLFLSFEGGMQLLTDRLAERILEMATGTSDETPLRLGTTVQSLALENAGASNDTQAVWKIRTDKGEKLAADALCLAVPSHVSAALLRVVDTELAAQLSEIPYASSATLNLGLPPRRHSASA